MPRVRCAIAENWLVVLRDWDPFRAALASTWKVQEEFLTQSTSCSLALCVVRGVCTGICEKQQPEGSLIILCNGGAGAGCHTWEWWKAGVRCTLFSPSVRPRRQSRFQVCFDAAPG